MPEKDVTGKTMEKAQGILSRIQALVKVKVFAGPFNERVDRRTARNRIANMTDQERLAMATRMGIDPFLEAMEELEPDGNTKPGRRQEEGQTPPATAEQLDAQITPADW